MNEAPQETTNAPSPQVPDDGPASTPEKGLRFWLIFLAMSIVTFLVALDTSIISTALPTIAAELGAGDLYIWVINTYLLSSTVFSAVYGQAANIFGRRSMITGAIVIFIVGSAVAGAAQNIGMMLSGRTIQGIGGGGIATMSEIVICDMVSYYWGCVGRGIHHRTHHRRRLCAKRLLALDLLINLPISGLALVLIITLLRLHNPRGSTSLKARVLSVDWVGNTILTLGVTSILLSLTWAGTKHPWSSWQTILPLALGAIGLGVFLVYEANPWVGEPTMPIRLFTKRTSAALFAISFIHSMMLFWVCYFMPVYFQAVLDASPTRSAVMLFPIATTT
ncbi:hypothetical protein MaudCBS49596_005186 [Microsporum audouinii]